MLLPRTLRDHGRQTFRPSTVPSTNTFRFDETTLHIRGAKWSSVKYIGESIWGFGDYDEEYNTHRHPLEKLPKTMYTSTTAAQEQFGVMLIWLSDLGTTNVPTGERTMDALWKTLLGGATSNSQDDTAVWRDRFYSWFALTYSRVLDILHEQERSADIPKKWMVPLVEIYRGMEERVLLFLKTHNNSIGEGQFPDQPLRKTILDLARRLYDVDSIEEMNSLGDAVRNTRLSAMFMIQDDPSSEPANVFNMKLNTIYDGRRIFSTANGHIGISSEAIQADDMIYLVAGADVPYVFRPVAGTSSTFTLIGEAYIHGLMDKVDFTEDDIAFESVHIL